MAHDSIKTLLDSLERSGRRRFTHSELARALNVSEQVITNWAKRGMSTEGALAAQFAFHMDANYLLGRIGHPMMVSRNDGQIDPMAREDVAQYVTRPPWPFESVTPGQWATLDVIDRQLIETLVQKIAPVQ